MALIDLRARAWGRVEALRAGKYGVRNHPGHPDQKSHGRKGSGGGPGSGRDLIGKVNADEIYPQDGDRRSATAAIVAQQGFDGPPAVTDAAGVDAVIAAGGVELYRGTSPEFAEEFRSGELHLSERGSSPLGTGIYTNGDPSAASLYAGEGGLMRMALSPDARTITVDDLHAERERRSGGFSDSEYFLFSSDNGAYAAAAGYDAIVPTPGAARPDHTIVLNRTALTVQREPATP